MHLEIKAAVDFLLEVLGLQTTMEPDLLDALGRNLACLLAERYQGHWYPDKPSRGQAYRCIRINPWQCVDESLLQACTLCGIEYSKLPLPKELTLWIDPFEVCGRLGEDTDYFTIATFEPLVAEEPIQDYFTMMATFRPLVNEEPVQDYFMVATFDPVENETPVLVYLEEPVQAYPTGQTSDYSSEGPSSGSVSENSSDDDETSGKQLKKTKEAVVVPVKCISPDEAMDTPSTSNAGTPVSELLTSEDQTINGPEALDAQ